MASIRELFISIGLDADTEGFNQLERGLDTVKKMAFAAGAAIGGLSAAVFAVAKSTANYADEVKDTSIAVGVSTQTLQEIGYAAQLSGASMEEAGDAFRFLARNASEAAKGGTGPAAEAFKALGVAVKGSNGRVRDSDALLMDLADRFKSLPEGPEKTAMAMDVFGRSGAKMVQLLNNGSAGIAEMRVEAQKLGMVMSDESIEAGTAFNDSLDRLKGTLVGIRNTVGAAVLPALTKLVGIIQDAITANMDWIKSGITRFMQGVISLIISMGRWISILVSGFTWLTDKVGGLIPVLKVVGTLLGLFMLGKFVQGIYNVAQGFVTIAKTLRLVSLSALTIPLLIGAVAALIFLIVDDVIAYFQGRPSVLGFLLKNKDAILEQLKAWLNQALQWFDWLREQVNLILEKMLTALFEWAGMAPDEAREAAENIVNVFRFIQDVWIGMVGALMDGIKILWPYVVDGFKTMVKGLVYIFEGLQWAVETFLEGVKAAIRTVGELIASPLETLKEAWSVLKAITGFGGPDFQVGKSPGPSPIAGRSADALAEGFARSVDNRTSSSTTTNAPTVNVTVQGAGDAGTAQAVASAVEEVLGNTFRSVERSNKPAFAQ